MKQLKGKIFWVSDTFDYVNEGINSKKDPYLHLVAKVSNTIVDEGMISFNVEEHKFQGEIYSYTVRLNNKHGSLYEGKILNEFLDEIGKINCELFQSNKKYLIDGIWHEFEEETEYLSNFKVILDK